jgi:hypothetical protein
MKIILYYLFLLVFIAIVTGVLIAGQGETAMSMQKMIGVSALLVLYTVAMSLIGEGKTEDEREVLHRHLATRAALIGGTIILIIGVMYQMFITHQLDYWLLIALIIINLTKIVSLIFLNYKK